MEQETRTLFEAHQELRDTDTPINELGYHSTNAMVEQIVQRLREEIVPPGAPILPPPVDNLIVVQEAQYTNNMIMRKHRKSLNQI